MRKFLKRLGLLILLLVLAFVIFVVYAVFDDYQPEAQESIYENKTTAVISDSIEFSLLIWNIGYCGLNREMDFFYDGGEKVRPEENVVDKNVNGVKTFLSRKKKTDFVLLQEVDVNSKRSYFINEYEIIENLFQSYTSTFGKNYDVFFVPVPVSNPLGKVESGLMTVSKYEPFSCQRYSFPGNYSFPTGLFMLDRCFLVNRYNLTSGKQLLVINTHNSAYDDGSLRTEQMDYLKRFLIEEYDKGNYVIVGGDWNQSPPNFKSDFSEDVMDNDNRKDIDFNYLPEWTWLYNNSVPTNRRIKIPYEQGVCLTTVIDFYLISPNIQAVSVENIDLGFEYSDHHPVELKVRLF